MNEKKSGIEKGGKKNEGPDLSLLKGRNFISAVKKQKEEQGGASEAKEAAFVEFKDLFGGMIQSMESQYSVDLSDLKNELNSLDSSKSQKQLRKDFNNLRDKIFETKEQSDAGNIEKKEEKIDEKMEERATEAKKQGEDQLSTVEDKDKATDKDKEKAKEVVEEAKERIDKTTAQYKEQVEKEEPGNKQTNKREYKPETKKGKTEEVRVENISHYRGQLQEFLDKLEKEKQKTTSKKKKEKLNKKINKIKEILGHFDKQKKEQEKRHKEAMRKAEEPPYSKELEAIKGMVEKLEEEEKLEAEEAKKYQEKRLFDRKKQNQEMIDKTLSDAEKETDEGRQQVSETLSFEDKKVEIPDSKFEQEFKDIMEDYKDGDAGKEMMLNNLLKRIDREGSDEDLKLKGKILEELDKITELEEVVNLEEVSIEDTLDWSKISKEEYEKALEEKSLKDLVNYLKLKTRTDLSDEQIEEQIKVANPEKIKEEEELYNQISELSGLLQKAESEVAEKKKEIFESLSAKTGLSTQEVEKIYGSQVRTIEEMARANIRKGQSLSGSLAKAGGKMAGYFLAGAGISFFTGGAGAAAGLGYAGIGAFRVWESYRSGKIDSKKLKKEIENVQSELSKEENSKEIINNIVAQIATRKQSQIDGRKDKLSEEEKNLDLVKNDYIHGKGQESELALEDNYKKVDELHKEELSNYLDNLGVSAEEKENIIKNVAVLNRVNFSNEVAGEKVKNKKKSFFEKFEEKVAKGWDKTLGFKYFKGGDTATEKATTSAVFTGLGAASRGIPILRNIMMGYAGMKAGDFAASFIKGESDISAGDIAKLDPENLKDKDEEIIDKARTQLLDEKFKKNNPTEYAKLKQEIDKFDEDLARKEENINGFLKSFNDKLEGGLRERLTKQQKTDLKKKIWQMGGAGLGFAGGEFAAAAIDYFNDQGGGGEMDNKSANTEASESQTGDKSFQSDDEVEKQATDKSVADQGLAKEKSPEEKGDFGEYLYNKKYGSEGGSEEMDTGILDKSEHFNFSDSSSPDAGSDTQDFQKDTEARGKTAEPVVTENAVIGEGEGIENALIKQLKANPEEFGFKGDIDDAGEVDKWAGNKAHKIAIDSGYVNTDSGSEVRVGDAGKTAYVLKSGSDGGLQVEEYSKNDDDKFVSREVKGSGSGYESAKERESYEYGYKSDLTNKSDSSGLDVNPTEQNETPQSAQQAEAESAPQGAETEIEDQKNIDKSSLNPDVKAETWSDFKGESAAEVLNKLENPSYEYNAELNSQIPKVGLDEGNIGELEPYLNQVKDTIGEPKSGESISEYVERYKSSDSAREILKNYESYLNNSFDGDKREAVTNILKGENVKESLSALFGKTVTPDNYSLENGMHKLQWSDNYDFYIQKSDSGLKFAIDGPGENNFGDQDSGIGIQPGKELSDKSLKEAMTWMKGNESDVDAQAASVAGVNGGEAYGASSGFDSASNSSQEQGFGGDASEVSGPMTQDAEKTGDQRPGQSTETAGVVKASNEEITQKPVGETQQTQETQEKVEAQKGDSSQPEKTVSQESTMDTGKETPSEYILDEGSYNGRGNSLVDITKLDNQSAIEQNTVRGKSHTLNTHIQQILEAKESGQSANKVNQMVDKLRTSLELQNKTHGEGVFKAPIEALEYTEPGEPATSESAGAAQVGGETQPDEASEKTQTIQEAKEKAVPSEKADGEKGVSISDKYIFKGEYNGNPDSLFNEDNVTNDTSVDYLNELTPDGDTYHEENLKSLDNLINQIEQAKSSGASKAEVNELMSSLKNQVETLNGTYGEGAIKVPESVFDGVEETDEVNQGGTSEPETLKGGETAQKQEAEFDNIVNKDAEEVMEALNSGEMDPGSFEEYIKNKISMDNDQKKGLDNLMSLISQNEALNKEQKEEVKDALGELLDAVKEVNEDEE